MREWGKEHQQQLEGVYDKEGNLIYDSEADNSSNTDEEWKEEATDDSDIEQDDAQERRYQELIREARERRAIVVLRRTDQPSYVFTNQGGTWAELTDDNPPEAVDVWSDARATSDSEVEDEPARQRTSAAAEKRLPKPVPRKTDRRTDMKKFYVDKKKRKQREEKYQQSLAEFEEGKEGLPCCPVCDMTGFPRKRNLIRHIE